MSLAEPIADAEQRPRAVARAVAWVALVVLPVAGLAVLLAAPATDVHWEHHPAHFWLVLSSSLTSATHATARATARGRCSASAIGSARDTGAESRPAGAAVPAWRPYPDVAPAAPPGAAAAVRAASAA